MDRDNKRDEGTPNPRQADVDRTRDAASRGRLADSNCNPPRTTTGKHFTAPKFGNAVSGGFELEPGPEKD